MARTRSAPRRRSTSVKPPVEAPTSTHARSSTCTLNSSRAPSSFSPARETKPSFVSTVSGSQGATRRPAFVTTWPPTRTEPARIKPRALLLFSGRPLSTSRASNRCGAYFTWESALSVAHEEGEVPQTRGVAVQSTESREGPLEHPVCLAPGAVEAVSADEGSLALLGVAPRALAQSVARGGGVEHVVYYLEAEAKLRGVLRYGGLFLFARRGEDRAYARRGLDESTGLVLVDHVQRLEVHLCSHPCLVHVHDLPPDHPVDPRGVGQLMHYLEDLHAAPLLAHGDER